jgi:hypothetical protein
MACFFNLKNLFDPGYNFVRAWIGWFVKIDDTIVFKHINRTFSWGKTARERSKMSGLNI